MAVVLKKLLELGHLVPVMNVPFVLEVRPLIPILLRVFS